MERTLSIVVVEELDVVQLPLPGAVPYDTEEAVGRSNLNVECCRALEMLVAASVVYHGRCVHCARCAQYRT